MAPKRKRTVLRDGRFVLDEYNLKILDELNENCRIPAVQLGKKIGISRGSVKDRMAEMESVGIIEGYTVMINWDLIDGGK